MSEYICPYCKQSINDDEALLCFYCGQSLDREVGFLGRLKYFKPKVFIIIIVAVVVGSFIVLMIR